MLTHNVALFTNEFLNKGEDFVCAHEDTGVCCPLCESAVTSFVQPALLPWHTDKLMLQCSNPACPGATTLTAADWFALTLPCVDMARGAAAVHAGGEAVR